MQVPRGISGAQSAYSQKTRLGETQLNLIKKCSPLKLNKLYKLTYDYRLIHHNKNMHIRSPPPRRRWHRLGAMSLLQGLVDEGIHSNRPPHMPLLDQLFAFIGSAPEKAVSFKTLSFN